MIPFMVRLVRYPELQGEVVKILGHHDRDEELGLTPVDRYEVHWSDGFPNTIVRKDRVEVIGV